MAAVENVIKALEKNGYEVKFFSKGTEAVQYLEKQKDKILNPKSGMDMIKGLGKLFKK